MGNKNSGNFEIELTAELFEQVNAVMGMRGRLGEFVSDERIPYNPDAKQSIDIVGESNFQDNLKKFKKGNSSDVWENGVLIPEPNNVNDPNVILLYLINNEYWIDPVGYVPRDLAAKLNRPLSNLMVAGKILPVLCKLVGGSPEFPNIGVKAWVKSDAINIAEIEKSPVFAQNKFIADFKSGYDGNKKPRGIFGGIKLGCGFFFWGFVILLLLGSC
jgi:hypothetical protein